MTNAAPFDLPEDDPPVPENGILQERPEQEEHKRKYQRRATAAEGGKRNPPLPAEAPPRSFEESNAAKYPSKEPSEKDVWPTKVGPLWLKILDWLPTQKIGEETATPEDVLIGLDRVSGGGQTGGAELEPIDGAAAAGDENESGDRALMRIVTDSYHIPVSDKRSRATFRAKFYWRRGGKGTIKQSESFTLDSPENLQKMRLARSQDGGEVQTLGPLPTAMANGAPLPPGLPPEILMELGELRAKVHGKPQVPAVIAAPPPVNVESQLEVARLQAQLQAEKDKAAEREKHQREMEALQQQVRDLQAAKDREAQEARFKALEARLNAPPAQDADARLAAVMLQQLQALGLVQVGPDGKPQPVGAGTPYQAPAVPPAQQVLAAAQVLASQQKEGENARETLRKAFGFADPRTEIVEAPEEKPEPSFWEKHVAPIAKGIMAHPEGPLAALAFIADGSPLGGMAKQAADAIGAGRAAVSAAKPTGPAPTSGGAGWTNPPSA